VVDALTTAGLKPVTLRGTDVASTPTSVDLRDFRSLGYMVKALSPKAVIHLAGIAFAAHNSAQELWSVNVEGSRNLLRALYDARCDPEIIIMASSANVYGNAKSGMLSETDIVDPVNPYATSKLAMEKVAREWMNTLPITITRPFNYTGRGQAINFLIPKIVQHYKQRIPKIQLGNLDISRDFSDVRDVAKIYVDLRTRPAGQLVNICSGTPHTLNSIMDICAELTGHRPNVEIDEELVRKNEVRRLWGNPDKLESLIGRIERKSINTTISWMLNHV
jgi:nucleoside-diphosphate-sugar epimerase